MVKRRKEGKMKGIDVMGDWSSLPEITQIGQAWSISTATPSHIISPSVSFSLSFVACIMILSTNL